MGNRRDRETFAALLRDLPTSHGSVREDVVLLDPDGFSLPPPHRLTARDTRPWVKREDVPLGLLPCGAAIEWTPDADRAAFAARLRRIEGKDCNPVGDLLLFTLTRAQLVLFKSPCAASVCWLGKGRRRESGRASLLASDSKEDPRTPEPDPTRPLIVTTAPRQAGPAICRWSAQQPERASGRTRGQPPHGRRNRGTRRSRRRGPAPRRCTAS